MKAFLLFDCENVDSELRIDYKAASIFQDLGYSSMTLTTEAAEMMKFPPADVLNRQLMDGCHDCMSADQVEMLSQKLGGREWSWLQVIGIVKDSVGPSPCQSIFMQLAVGQSEHDVTYLLRHGGCVDHSGR